MDGIAVRAADTIGASPHSPLVIGRGSYEVVDTGDPLPEGFDAVVMREDVVVTDGNAELCAEVGPYHNVRSIGEDIVAHELVLSAGHRLRAVDIAACAAAGVTEVLVRRRPVVAVLPTGDEIRPVGTDLERGQFYDTNSIMLAAQARELGCEALVLPIEPDDPERIGAAILEATAHCDLLIVIAGASAGRDDYTAAVISSLGVLAVHGVAIRPGHPVMLGAVGSTPVLAAPGYPVSAALSFDVFAAPFIARLEGTVGQARPWVTAHLARAITSRPDVDEWVRVRLGRIRGRLVALALPRGAGVLTSLVRADGLLLAPAGPKDLNDNSEVEIHLVRDPAELYSTVVLVGADDPALDLLSSALRASDDKRTLAVWELDALGALRGGLCHLAGSTRLEQSPPDYFEQALPGRHLAVVRLARRQQGLIVALGNPLGLGALEDLAGGQARYVNRQEGSGTRALLDHELDRLGITPASIPGYEREEHTHLAVAAAVSSGRCDCGLGVLAAARAFGLSFVPLMTEPYDLVLEADLFEDRLLVPFWDLLASGRFQASVRELGGYDTSEMGRRLL